MEFDYCSGSCFSNAQRHPDHQPPKIDAVSTCWVASGLRHFRLNLLGMVMGWTGYLRRLRRPLLAL